MERAMTVGRKSSSGVTAALVLVAATSLVLPACRRKELAAADVPVPAFVGDESADVLKTRYQAVDAFTLPQANGSYRVLVFKLRKINDADSDYRVVAYRRQGDVYVRQGAEINLLDFERPRLSKGPTPRIETTMNRLGVRFHVVLDQTGAQLVPTEGTTDGGGLIGADVDHLTIRDRC
ncbi:MAG: hypothetical protein HYV09_38400 [Deltaproteobacteria bacterium]|nr:hypothetical protein [Deltaproteobacteria bacterium]